MNFFEGNLIILAYSMETHHMHQQPVLIESCMIQELRGNPRGSPQTDYKGIPSVLVCVSQSKARKVYQRGITRAEQHT